CFARLFYCTIFTLFQILAFAGALPLHPGSFFEKKLRKKLLTMRFSLQGKAAALPKNTAA
ncbi:MAG: hypothetical protein II388_11345, partial [Clostridia bacterium]|nr:hypothetical protein [Clostridia bacterium]